MSNLFRVQSRHGSALVSALAVVAMSALAISGVVTLASSHSVRQFHDANYELALQLADAGLNYELNFATVNHSAHLSTSPFSGSIPGIAGTFSVYVTNQDGTTNYVAGNPMTVISTGTVNGIARSVSINASPGGGTSIFNPATGDSGGYGGGFAVFGYSTVTFTQSSSTMSGDMGTNGKASVNSNGNGNVNGNIVLDGPSATTSNINNHATVKNSTVMAWPNVDTICAAAFPSGWSTLTSTSSIAAQSGRMRTYASNSPVNTVAGTKYIGWTNKTSLSSADLSALNVSTLILPPGDYYFTDINVNSNNLTIIFDTAAQTVPGGVAGPIHLWMNNSTNADTINCQFSFTKNSDPSMFRIYYDKAANITLAGNMTYFGGLYGIRAGSSSSTSHATITVGANTKVTGYLIADDVILTGGAVVTNAPGNPGVMASSDYTTGSSNYAYANSWKELPINSGSVFIDGSNN